MCACQSDCDDDCIKPCDCCQPFENCDVNCCDCTMGPCVPIVILSYFILLKVGIISSPLSGTIFTSISQLNVLLQNVGLRIVSV